MAPRNLAILLALLPGVVSLVIAAAGPEAKTQFFTGSVTPLKEAKVDLKLDPATLVILGEDGKAHPLKKDAASMMFFTDVKLLRRPMRLTGRLLPDGQLQVVQVHSLLKGKLHDVYYWCEVCQIKRFQAGVCDCCGAPLEFREEPAK